MTPATLDLTAYRGRRVLVTGGTGFIGSSLSLRLVQLGAEVTVLDAMLPELGGNPFNLEQVADRVRIHDDDIRDERVIPQRVAGMDFVFHCAAQMSHVKGQTDPYPDLDINIRGTTVLLESLRTTCPDAILVRLGTRGQYGAVARLPASEETPCRPIGLHEISMHAAEMICARYHASAGIACVMLRLSNIYGPRAQMRSHHYGVANWMVRLALDGQLLTVFGDGAIKRDFVFVDDCVDALLRCGLEPRCRGEVINLGSDEPSSFLELAETICRTVAGAHVVFTEWSAERKAQEPGDFYSDISKLEHLTGWRPMTTLGDGIAATVDFYRRHRAHYW